jgi:serine/threonine protein phosphatase PrpC
MTTFKSGSYTDIGGYYENQDKSFSIKLDNDIIVQGVFDGHGTNGNLVADTANTFAITYFTEQQNELKLTPKNVLTQFCDLCNDKIRETILEKIEGSYVDKDFIRNKNGTILHGGTTCTLIAIIDYVLHTICLGDSSATLHSQSGKITDDMLIECTDTYNDQILPKKDSDIIKDNMIIISGDQSADDEHEFLRTKGTGAQHLYQLFRHQVKPVFNKDGLKMPISTSETSCNTVRGDFPSIISCPNRDYDLALTRALGDFYMCQYGLTWRPIYRSINIQKLLSGDSYTCVMIASDGVWDNWKYEDVHDFIMHESCINSMILSKSSSENVAKAFIERNDVYAKSNFGRDRDNSTVVLTFIK